MCACTRVLRTSDVGARWLESRASCKNVIHNYFVSNDTPGGGRSTAAERSQSNIPFVSYYRTIINVKINICNFWREWCKEKVSRRCAGTTEQINKGDERGGACESVQISFSFKRQYIVINVDLVLNSPESETELMRRSVRQIISVLPCFKRPGASVYDRFHYPRVRSSSFTIRLSCVSFGHSLLYILHSFSYKLQMWILSFNAVITKNRRNEWFSFFFFLLLNNS